MATMECHGRAAGKVEAQSRRNRREHTQACSLLLGQHLGMDHEAALPSQMRRSGVASQAFTLPFGRPITVCQNRI